MLQTVHGTLQAQLVLSIFVLIGLGDLIGGIRLGGFSLVPVAGARSPIASETMSDCACRRTSKPSSVLSSSPNEEFST